MAAGVLVVQAQVALLGSCEGHSWISWQRGAARGHSKQDPGEDAVSITFCSLVSSTDPLSCPDRNCLLRRIPNERPFCKGKDPSFPFKRDPPLPFRGGGGCLKRGWAPMGGAQGWAVGSWSSPGRVCVTALGPRVTSAQTKWERAGQHVLSSSPLPMAPDGDHMEPKVKVQQMNLIL